MRKICTETTESGLCVSVFENDGGLSLVDILEELEFGEDIIVPGSVTLEGGSASAEVNGEYSYYQALLKANMFETYSDSYFANDMSFCLCAACTIKGEGCMVRIYPQDGNKVRITSCSGDVELGF